MRNCFADRALESKVPIRGAGGYRTTSPMVGSVNPCQEMTNEGQIRTYEAGREATEMAPQVNSTSLVQVLLQLTGSCNPHFHSR